MGLFDKFNDSVNAKLDEMNPANIARNKMNEAKYNAQAKVEEAKYKAKETAKEKAKEGAAFVGNKAKEGGKKLGKKMISDSVAPYKNLFGFAKKLAGKGDDESENVQSESDSQDAEQTQDEAMMEQSAASDEPYSHDAFESKVEELKGKPAALQEYLSACALPEKDAPQDFTQLLRDADYALNDDETEKNIKKMGNKEYDEDDVLDESAITPDQLGWAVFVNRLYAKAKEDKIGALEMMEITGMYKKLQKKNPSAFERVQEKQYESIDFTSYLAVKICIGTDDCAFSMVFSDISVAFSQDRELRDEYDETDP